MKQGIVYLIGAGPGDEGLLTLRGKECLEVAEVVIYDHLANPRLLRHCRPGVEQIYVGKQASCHTRSQQEINALLVEQARAGRTVARLKGGDPCVFGRGGEEALALAEAGLSFEIIPGITAAVAASAYAGIPLTHRGLASSLALITGHNAAGREEEQPGWSALARGADTLVFYMGVKNLPQITAHLIENGKPPNTPAALISWGTLNNQFTLRGTLESIAFLAAEQGIRPPALCVIGEVVTLRDKLRWFDTRPLYGRKIVVTRSRDQVSSLAGQLRRAGALVEEFPTINLIPRENQAPLDCELERLASYQGIVFTSTNAVDIFCRRLFSRGKDARSLQGIQLIVIGRETGRALEQYGLRPDLIPEQFTSEGVMAALRASGENLAGRQFLIPGSTLARDYIPRQLEAMGAAACILPVYDNLPPACSPGEIEALFAGASEVYFTFTSSSTVKNLVAMISEYNRALLSRVKGFSIGPVTSRTAREAGIPVLAEAAVHRIPELVDTIIRYFKEPL